MAVIGILPIGDYEELPGDGQSDHEMWLRVELGPDPLILGFRRPVRAGNPGPAGHLQFYIDTARRHGHDVLTVLRGLMTGHPLAAARPRRSQPAITKPPTRATRGS